MEKLYSDTDTLTSYLMLSSLKVDSLTILPQMDKFKKKNINMKKNRNFLHCICMAMVEKYVIKNSTSGRKIM